MATTHGAPPFHCAAFAITSRQTSRRPGDERWRVNPAGLDWDELFVEPQGQQEYEESAFTQLATRSGWRLLRVVPAGQHQRRLYYERTRIGPAGLQDTYRQQTKEQSMAQDDAEPAAAVRFVSALLGLDNPAADPWEGTIRLGCQALLRAPADLECLQLTGCPRHEQLIGTRLLHLMDRAQAIATEYGLRASVEYRQGSPGVTIMRA